MGACMRYPAYPEYKESGVLWLGQVPGHWAVKGLRYVCRLAYGDSLAAETREDGDIAVFGSNGRVGSHISANTKSPVIVVGRKGSFGKINYSDEPVFAIDTTYFIDGSCTKNALSWLRYSLLPLRLDETSKDSAVPGLAREDAYESRLPVPPLPEQTAIADFLDRETGRIDTLVTKKRRLIALLKEQRTALISRTVTRGLPADAAREFGLEPHTRFKDSGIEWLGQVPEGWEPTPLKFIAGIQTGYAFSSDDFTDEGIPVLRIGDITRDGCVDFTNAKYLPETYKTAYSKVLITRGAIVMAMTGATIGKAGKYDLDDPALLNQRVCSFYSTGNNDQGFLWYLLNADFYLEHIKLTAFGGAQPNISDTELLGCVVAVAPATEQTAIATYLDRETAKIDKLVEKVDAAIARLQEYRTALITAAVTGKIDVREAVA